MLSLTSENRVFAIAERGVPTVTRCINGSNLGDNYKMRNVISGKYNI